MAKGRTAADEILGHHALREQAISDPLTGLGNRRKLAERLGEWSAQDGSPAPRPLMLFDLDGFKRYNDTFGHPAGDAQALTMTGGDFSITASYGVVHLPHEADTLERALQLADERMYSHKRVRTAR